MNYECWIELAVGKERLPHSATSRLRSRSYAPTLDLAATKLNYKRRWGKQSQGPSLHPLMQVPREDDSIQSVVRSYSRNSRFENRTCAPTIPCLNLGRSVSHWSRRELKSTLLRSLSKLLRMHHGRSLWLCESMHNSVLLILTIPWQPWFVKYVTKRG